MSRRKELINIRAGNSEIRNRKTREKIDKTKNSFFQKINESDTFLAILTQIKREKKQITNARNKTEDIALGYITIKGIIKQCCERLYTHKFHTLEEMDQFFKKHELLKSIKMEEIT